MGMILTRRYNVDRFGYLIPHRYGNLPVLGAVATFRPGEGKFGRGAVAVEGGTTNLIINPLFKNGLNGWLKEGADSSNTIEVENISTPYGDKALVVTAQGGTPNPYQRINLPAGTIVTVTVVARRVSGVGNPYLRWGAGYNMDPPLDIKENGKWYTFSRTSEVGGNHNLILRTPTNANARFEYAFVQLEEKPFATSFVDGTRAAGRLVYPTSVFNPAQGTISMWVRKHQLIDDNRRVFWSETGSYRFGIHDRLDGRLVWAYVTASGQTTGGFFTPGTWHHLVMTWHRDEGWMRGYLDGEPAASRTFDPGTDPGFVYSDTWGLGAKADGSLAFDGLFDELLILPYAASEEEIRAWYEAQGPLPPHPQASLQWDRQTVRPAQMVKL